jgi:hypothetical protein
LTQNNFTDSLTRKNEELKTMTKPTKSSAELVETIRTEMKAGCPPTMQVHVKPDGSGWRALTNSESMIAYADCAAFVGQIAARLRLSMI